MHFQIVDNNQKCKKVFDGSDLVDFSNDLPLSKTWKYSEHLQNSDVEYAYLYAGCEISDSCPGILKDWWNTTSKKVSSIIKSTYHAKCDLDETCIYDYIPDKILLDFLKCKQSIIQYVFEHLSKPKCYDILEKAHILTEEMNAVYNYYDGKKSKTNYNIFGTRTGRLSNAKSTIPILTMKREQRKLLTPTNDLFVEFDFNAAELRTLLALSDKQQPHQDIHDWNTMQASSENIDREQMKKRTFAWLYNPEASDRLLEGIYDRNTILTTYKTQTGIKTPFFREIDCEDRKSLNYIVQSTSSDICIEQAFKLRNFFRHSRTKICYLLHDSVILDFAKEDVQKFSEAKQIFSNTRFGNYVVNSSIGKNFGEMRKI